MTPQSRRELAAATDLIGYGPYLDRVGARDGQRRHPSDNTDEPARARLACTLAEQGRAVAVVSSGDPGVFAMATAVLEEAKQWPGVAVRVIPAMTAAQAVASRVGAPLGHDYAVISLSDRLKPWDVIATRLTAAAAADLVLAIYNPASKTRTWQVGAMRDLLLEHRDPGTPVVIGRDVSGPREEVKVVRLADLDPADVDMRCLLIVGSSQTQWYDDRVFTPRRYPTLMILIRHAMTIPRGPEDVTPAWLGSVLGADVRDVDVTADRHRPDRRHVPGAARRTRRRHRTCPPRSRSSCPPRTTPSASAWRSATGPRSSSTHASPTAMRIPVPPCFYSRHLRRRSRLRPAARRHGARGAGRPDRRVQRAGGAASPCEALAGLHGPSWCDPEWMDLAGIAMPKPGDDAAAGGLGEISVMAADITDRQARRRHQRRGPGNPHRRNVFGDAVADGRARHATP